ncbi:hypothetical protein Q5M85_17735 [Paraclostridium bifermentans]|nr:hypothetical protein [Paraclostridium bifermentans]
MGALAVARVPWDKWLKFIAPFTNYNYDTGIGFLVIGLQFVFKNKEHMLFIFFVNDLLEFNL